jgi:trimethylamine--corrinoid protein Co-methyltransferase
MKRNLQAGARRNAALRLEVLTEQEIDEIHLATLEVLERTGVFIEDDEALEILHGGGARIDAATKVARLPGHIVEAALATTPRYFAACGRSPDNDYLMSDGRVGFTNFGEGIAIVDTYTGELRAPTKKDVGDSARMVDALDQIDVYERALGAHDVPQEVAALHNAHAIMTNTSKHAFIGPLDGFQCRHMIRMAQAIAGGPEQLRERPFVTSVTCPVSPLKLVRECCEIIVQSARAGIATNVLTMAMAGGSSPVTLAGTLVVQNAEILAGLTLAQLTAPGSPIVYGSSTTALDLRLASASVGSPELALISAAVVQIARRYQLPSWVAGA